MNKKLIAAMFLTLPLISFADSNNHVPYPENLKGIQFVSLQDLNIPQDAKNKIIQDKIDEKKRGYVINDNNNSEFLLTIKKNAPQEIQQYKNLTNDPYDTHLKSTYSEIKLSFPFNGLKDIDSSNIIGYAAVGSYLKNTEKEGWNGIRVFFSSDIGVCSYQRMGIISIQLDKETIEYIVNGKPSSKSVEGNLKNGFIYDVTWYTNDNIFNIECANKEYNSSYMDKLVLLANKIDKN